MEITKIITTILFFIYGLAMIYMYFRDLGKKNVSSYFNTQGGLSGLVSIFFGVMNIVGGVDIDFFKWAVD